MRGGDAKHRRTAVMERLEFTSITDSVTTFVLVPGITSKALKENCGITVNH
jgi:hypothetical protein